MKYSDDIIQRVRDASDIVAIVSEYVPLKKAGVNYKGLCPFHNEKSPSFMVSPSRHGFHCFGCGKGGNAITFVMEMEKLPFPEALRLLAEKAGIVLPKPQEERRDQEEERRRERLQDLNDFAGKFFQQKLLSEEGKAAREYFKGRGFTKEDALKYGIGYAPAGWDALKNEALKAGFTQEELVAGGLLSQNEEKHSVYDKFRDRLIFPVRNTYDKLIAFGGRALSDEAGPKYLNSPETLLFKKSECLYLLNEAREAIRQKGYVLVVEGYFDALALHHHGLENAVATLGTALTSQHGRMLKRYTQEVVLLYDADEAGQAAAARGAEAILSAGLKLRVLRLPDAKDPDEYLGKHPREDLEALVTKAPEFFRWWAASIRSRSKGAPVEERLRAAGAMAPMVLGLPDEAAVLAACAAVESELSLDPRTMVDLVNAARRTKGGGRAPSPSAPGTPAPPLGRGPEARLEADFLALLTEQNGEFLPWAVNELSPEAFPTEGLRRLFERLQEGSLETKDLAGVEELAPSFLRIESESEPRMREAMLIDLAGALKNRQLRRLLAELRERQAEAEREGRSEEALELAQQMVLLKRRHTQEVEPK
jgi:DNA primase